MGRGRATTTLAAALAALAVAGCGAESHPNDPRPQSPTRISVSLNSSGLRVQPAQVGYGEERNQQIPQNQNHPQPRIKTSGPLMVVFVIANQTGHSTALRLRGTRDAVSARVPAYSPGTFQTELPTGSYSLTAAGVPTRNEPTLQVGPVRTSSQNDLLEP